MKRKCLLVWFEYHVRAELFNKLLLLYVHPSLLTWRTSKPFRFLIRQQSQQTMCRGRQMLIIGAGVVGVWEQPNNGHLPIVEVPFIWCRVTTWEDNRKPTFSVSVLCMGLTSMRNNSCKVCSGSLNHKACNVPTQLRCSQHFCSVMSRGFFLSFCSTPWALEIVSLRYNCRLSK